MRKVAIAIVIVLLIVGGVLYYASTQVDRFVGDALEGWISATTGTSASVRSVDVSLRDSRGQLSGITIGNPKGYSTNHLLRIGNVKLAVDLGSVTSGVPVVKEVLVDDVHLNAEQRGSATNITDVQDYMSKTSPSPEAAGEPEGKIVIDRFKLTHGTITLTSELLSRPEELELADVTVDGIGRSQGGATYGEATEAILNPILRAARAAVEARLKDAAGDAARKRVEESASDKLKKLLDRD